MAAAPIPVEASGSSGLRAGSFVLALLFRTVPERRRFQTAIRVARWLEPLIGRTSGYQRRARLGTDSLRETSLELLLMTLTRNGTTFETPIEVEGAEHLPAAGSGAALFVGPHTMLTTLFIRVLDSAGLEPVAISANEFLMTGTRTPARVLLPSAQLLLRVRGIFRQGGTVLAMIDRADPERRNRLVHRAGKSLRVSDPLLRLALRHEVRIIFMSTRLDASSRVIVRLSVPGPKSDTVEEVVRDFAEFV